MMPTDLFKEAMRSATIDVSLAAVNALAVIFKANFPATAIRYVDLSGDRVVLVFNGTNTEPRRRWSSRSKRLPQHLWVERELDTDSYASDLISAAVGTKRVGKMPAEVWFPSSPSNRFEIQKHSIRFGEGVYTLLHLTDEELLAERLSAKRA